MIEGLLLPAPSPYICTIALMHRVVHTRRNDRKMLHFLLICGDAILKEENGQKLNHFLTKEEITLGFLAKLSSIITLCYWTA